jgi:hypothetical protein
MHIFTSLSSGTKIAIYIRLFYMLLLSINSAGLIVTISLIEHSAFSVIVIVANFLSTLDSIINICFLVRYDDLLKNTFWNFFTYSFDAAVYFSVIIISLIVVSYPNKNSKIFYETYIAYAYISVGCIALLSAIFFVGVRGILGCNDIIQKYYTPTTSVAGACANSVDGEIKETDPLTTVVST